MKINTFFCRVLLSTAVSAGCSNFAVAQQLVAEKHCRTIYEGQLIQGLLKIEYWNSSGNYQISGQFSDPRQNLIEFNIESNRLGGVGRLWINHARQTEKWIRLEFVGKGFVAQDESGNIAQYECN